MIGEREAAALLRAGVARIDGAITVIVEPVADLDTGPDADGRRGPSVGHARVSTARVTDGRVTVERRAASLSCCTGDWSATAAATQAAHAAGAGAATGTATAAGTTAAGAPAAAASRTGPG